MTDWAEFWDKRIGVGGEPESDEVLESSWMDEKAPAALREFWRRASDWGDRNSGALLDVAFAKRHSIPYPGGFAFGVCGWDDKEKVLFVDVDGFAGRGEGAIMAWDPDGKSFSHLYYVSPSMEAFVERAEQGKRLRPRELGAIQARELESAIEQHPDSIETTPPDYFARPDLLLPGKASMAIPRMYCVFSTLQIPSMGLRIVGKDELKRHRKPAGHWIGEDDEADYVVTKTTFGKAGGRLYRIDREDAESDDLGYLIDVVTRWVESSAD